MRPIYIIEMLVLAAFWGLSFYFMRVSSHEFGPVTLIFLRTLSAALFLTPVFLYKQLLAESIKHWRHMFMVGLLNSAIPFTLFSFSTLTLEAGITSILNATAPMFGAIIGVFWLKASLTKTNILGIFIGFFGVSILVSGQGLTLETGKVAVLAAISASVCYGIAASYTKKYLQDASPLAVATASQWMSALMLLVPSLLLWPAEPVSQQAWINVALLGVVSTALAYVMYFHLINRIGAVKAITVAYLVPVFGVLWGSLLLGEVLTTNQTIGALLVLIGVSLATGFKLKSKAQQTIVASERK